MAGTLDSVGSLDGSRLAANFQAPGSIALDGAGNLFVVDGCTGFHFSNTLIRKIDTSGNVTTVGGSKSYSGVSASGVNNKSCNSITTHPDGNFYISDGFNRVVQRVSPQGVFTVIAGSAGSEGATDANGQAARFKSPNRIAADLQGNLYVTDTGNHSIRQIDSAGNVVTFAGKSGVVGSADGNLQTALFNQPVSIKVDNNGIIYISDRNGIRRIANGLVTTLITQQQLMQDLAPGGDIIVDGLDLSVAGLMAVALSNGSDIGLYQGSTLILKLGSGANRGDADGSPTNVKLYFPSGVRFLPNGDLIISDVGNHNLKRYSPTSGLITLYAGRRNDIFPVDGPKSIGRLQNRRCMYVASSGEIWFNESDSLMQRLRKVDSSQNIVTLTSPISGQGNCVIQVNPDGSFIAADSSASGNLRLIKAGAVLQTLSTQFDLDAGLQSAVVGAADDIYFVNSGNTISKYSNGVVSPFSTLVSTRAVAYSPSLGLIAADGCAVFSISNLGVSSPITKTGPCGYQDGPVANAAFNVINGIAIGADGSIYVSDWFNSVIRRIKGGVVDTVFGTPWVEEASISGTGGLYKQLGISYDASKNALIIGTFDAIIQANLP